ncbi:MAG: Cna B-type domain-containing protein [Clostridia bacterium]|nr:Cna B-type domain-containing protein [Clostridia bacterium]
MDGNMLEYARAYITQYKKRKRWLTAVIALAVVVAVFTVYEMSTPAHTMEEKTFCGLTVHEHNEKDGCYEEKKVLTCGEEERQGHTHTAECFEKQPVLVCTLTEQEEHIHCDECYEKKEEIVCGVEESGGHTHTAECFEKQPVLVCTLTEQEGHTHCDECYEKKEEIVCGVKESEGHTHTAECFEKQRIPVCALDEDENHAHGDECYEEKDVLVCTLEESEGHTHTEECIHTENILICGMEENPGHRHGDECYEENDVLVCTLEESEGHTHTEECIHTEDVLVCGMEESPGHQHGDECYEENDVLVCALEESEGHTHSDACYANKKVIVCEPELPTHTLQCYSDPQADTETAAVMKQSVKSAVLSGKRGDDVALIAETQLGYGESEKNYLVDDSGNIRGYTRYGAFGNSPYDDWGVLFCTFCCKYAGVDSEYLTNPEYCGNIQKVLTKHKLLLGREYTAVRGDIVFLSDIKDENGNTVTANRAGIIRSVKEGKNGDAVVLTVIEGNRDGKVSSFSLESDSPEITGYCKIPVNPKELFTLSAVAKDGVKFTVSGSRSAFKYPAENLSLTVSTVHSKSANEMIDEAVANLGSEKSRYSVIKNYLYDISIIYTSPETGKKTEVEPDESLTLSIEGIDGDERTETVKLFHIDSASGTAEALSSGTDKDGAVSAQTDSFSVYGVSLLAASGNGISYLSKITSSGTYYLTQDITVSSTVWMGNVNSTLDLNGHKITVSCNPAIGINGGTLTIVDSSAGTVTTVESDFTRDDFGKTASYNSSTGKLTYYVTETQVVNEMTGATQEKLVKYTVSNAGMIVGKQNGRAIEISGGGTLNFDGGYICNFKNDDGGAIRISENNSKMTLNGGVLAANSSNKGGAIFLNGYSTLNVKSGVISGNTATGDGGGGIYAVSYWQYAQINVTGGYITNNYASNGDYWAGGGGIQLERLAQLIMSDGYITANKANGGGGGIKTRQDWGGNESGSIDISGGFITANNAIGAEGGGINVNAGGAMTMHAGYITNNIAGTGKNDPNFQHWGGGGVFCSENSCSVMIMDSLFTNNSAGGFGGGVAGCSTGRIESATNSGSGIFDNEALGLHTSGGESTKNEDHFYAAESEVFMSHGYQDYFCALSTNISGGMLGGGTAHWEGSSDGAAVSTDSINDSITGCYVTGLTCNASEVDKQNAESVAHSFFNGNESPTHGGGILINGYLVLGKTEEFKVPARLQLSGLRKRLLSLSGEEYEQTEGTFRFVVVDEYGEIVSSAYNDAGGNISLDRRLPFFSDGTFTYYIYEVTPESTGGIQYDTSRYKMEVTLYADRSTGYVPWTNIIRVQYKFSNIKVTEMNSGTVLYNADPGNDEAHAISISPLSGRSFDNYVVPSQPQPDETPVNTYVKVKKVWNTTGQTPSSVNVTLLEDGNAKATVTLNRSNNWTYEWSNLSTGKEYTVSEADVSGYAAEYSYSYSYDSTTVESDESNGVLLYKLNSSGKYVLSTQLSTGSKYIISSPDGKKLLYITQAHNDSALTSADTVSAVRNADNSYDAASIPDNCVFKYEATHNNDNNYNFYCLANQGVNSFLLAQESGGTYLKGTSGTVWSSPIRISNGRLQAQFCPDSWKASNPWRYIIWTGTQFDTASDITKLTYNVISGSHKNYTVTNTPVNKVEYSLAIKKCEKDNTGHVLSGAVFELRDGDTVLGFTEISPGHYSYSENGTVTRLTTPTNGYIRISALKAGIYTVRELVPPYGYVTSAQTTVTFDENTPDRSLEIEIENEKFVLVLPQTGAGGVTLFYTFGVLLCLGALMYGIYGRRKRKEVNRTS